MKKMFFYFSIVSVLLIVFAVYKMTQKQTVTTADMVKKSQLFKNQIPEHLKGKKISTLFKNRGRKTSPSASKKIIDMDRRAKLFDRTKKFKIIKKEDMLLPSGAKKSKGAN